MLTPAPPRSALATVDATTCGWMDPDPTMRVFTGACWRGFHFLTAAIGFHVREDKIFLHSRCVDGCHGDRDPVIHATSFFSFFLLLLFAGGSGGPLRWVQGPRIHPLG
ncbi:hypothetical protein B0T10DRAFT_475117 [Thelonectria olida]|uniref:Uncharacterized protein n=1 Tax=Thelonectria olida TaxID=1576542 RepID=A0A9P8WD78_9HYPO|nr:hypothetical protein B0T10DRAFT_475117 [Thelonectria olida]